MREADQKVKLDDILETYRLPRPAHETGEARELRAVASWNELGRSQVLGWSAVVSHRQVAAVAQEGAV